MDLNLTACVYTFTEDTETIYQKLRTSKSKYVVMHEQKKSNFQIQIIIPFCNIQINPKGLTTTKISFSV